MEFVKHDAGKLRFDLIDHEFEAELAAVLTHGAAKYADNNWQNAGHGEARARYYAAFRRHALAWRRGEEIDADSGLPHLACMACCLMFLRWFERESADFNEQMAQAIQERIEERKEMLMAQVDAAFDSDEDHSWRVPLSVPRTL